MTARMPRGIIYALRTLAFIGTPVVANIFLYLMMEVVGKNGMTSGAFYMRYEATLLCYFALHLVGWYALIALWTENRKRAIKVLWVSLAAMSTILLITTSLETANTKPIAAVEASFVKPEGLTPVKGVNGDMFAAASSGLLPCVDLMAVGCPSIQRVWKATPNETLTVLHLNQALKDSGWDNVKIQLDQCSIINLPTSSRYQGCTAQGTVGDYHAIVQIVNINGWEMRLSLRPEK